MINQVLNGDGKVRHRAAGSDSAGNTERRCYKMDRDHTLYSNIHWYVDPAETS